MQARLLVWCALLVAGCGGSSPSVGSPCDPAAEARDCGTTFDSNFVLRGLVCDAKTKKCITPLPCAADADCAGGYTCTSFDPKVCLANCSFFGTSSRCQDGFKCQADFTCAEEVNCNP